MKKSVLILVLISLFLIGCANKENVIVIGSKNFTEQIILGEMLSLLIEKNTDIKVDKKLNLGGTNICFNALKNGSIDLYPEYTGTALVLILGKKTITDPEKVYNIVKKDFMKKYKLEVFEPFGFNNAYTLTIRKEDVKKLNIHKISDLKKYKNEFKPGFDHEFMVREDGYPGLIKHYGFEFKKDPMELDPGLMYRAIAEKQVDIICGFGTDGRIPAFDLEILEDDLDFFPPYYATTMVRQETLEKYPQLKPILNKLGGIIDDKKMTQMNYLVDEKNKRAINVAKDFLVKQGLI